MSVATTVAARVHGMSLADYRVEVDPVLFGVLDRWEAPVALQERVTDLAYLALGTAGDLETAEARRRTARDWLWDVYARTWLEALGLSFGSERRDQAALVKVLRVARDEARRDEAAARNRTEPVFYALVRQDTETFQGRMGSVAVWEAIRVDPWDTPSHLAREAGDAALRAVALRAVYSEDVPTMRQHIAAALQGVVPEPARVVFALLEDLVGEEAP